MKRLLYSFSKSYSIEKQEKFIEILKKLRPYLINIESKNRYTPKIGVSLNTGVSFGVLPTELIWEILLYLKPIELVKFYSEGKKEYKQIFKNDNFWKKKFYIDYVSPKKYGKDGYVYPYFIRNLFSPKDWFQRYLRFYNKIKEFNKLNGYLLENKMTYDAGVVIKRLPKIFIRKRFEMGSVWGNLGSTWHEMRERLFGYYYKYTLYYGDKLFLVNIIKIITEEMKIFKSLGETGWYSPHGNKDLLLRYILGNFSDKLKNDKEIFLMLIKFDFKLVRYTGEELRKDREFALVAIKEGGETLEYFPLFKNDTEMVLTAVSNNGSSLKFSGKWLRDNKGIVLAAIKKNPMALEFASDDLKDDEELVKKVIKEDRKGLVYASQRLKDKYNYEPEYFIP